MEFPGMILPLHIITVSYICGRTVKFSVNFFLQCSTCMTCVHALLRWMDPQDCSLLRTEFHSSQLIAGADRYVLQSFHDIQCTRTCMYIIWHLVCFYTPCAPSPQLRTEMSLPHVIGSIEVVLQPLCFILEWGSLHAILSKMNAISRLLCRSLYIYLYMQYNHCVSPWQKFLILWVDSEAISLSLSLHLPPYSSLPYLLPSLPPSFPPLSLPLSHPPYPYMYR